MIYNEKEVQRITRELKSRFNIRSRNASQVLKASIDCVMWDMAEGKIKIEEVYNSIFSDLDFSGIYFDGQCANIANRAVEKIKEIA